MENVKKEVSCVTSRYMQMIGKNYEDFEASKVTIQKSPIYNQFIKNVNVDVQDSFVAPFHSPLDSTDILIGDSNDFYNQKPAQISFMPENKNSIQFDTSIPSEIENTFEARVSKDNENLNFMCPPIKRFCRDSQTSFFNPSIIERSSVMASDLFFRYGNTNYTEDLFNERYSKDGLAQSTRLATSFSDIRKPVPKIQFQLSQTSASVSQLSNCENSAAGDTNQAFEASNIENASKFTEDNNSFMKDKENEECPSKMKKSGNKINTFYQAPYILDTEKIDEYYKTHTFDEWDPTKYNLDNIMEPSLDYLAYKLKCLKPLTTGSEEEDLDYENDAFNCKSINGTIEEIEETFDDGKFICSTPKQKETDDVNTEANILDIGFINMLTDPSNNPEDDTDKTRSFLVNNDGTNNVWSALTHVSCSVPQSEEPQFDITTIFDFNYRDDEINAEENKGKYIEDDITRYELILSILKDCDNPFEKTTVDMHETIKLVQSRKAAILSQIEMMIQGLVTSLVKNESMILKLHRIKDWKDCKYESNMLSQKETAIKIKSISFTNKNTERTFTIVVHLLGEIFKMLNQNMTCTKRELYYRDVELMKSQNSVNKAIDEICRLLNVQCWELGVLSTSKGLIAGDLKITTEDDEVIDYSTTNSVPQKPSSIKSIESCAEYVLVVEKDTVFTRLMEDGIMEKIGTKIILITAKGYPDINTRLLLKKIETELSIPIYIIVDADPFGIDIMCTYKFGSLQMVQFSEQLAITKMQWIGIHPSDIERLDITRTQLTDADLKKVDELMKRPYMNKQLEKELMCFKEHGLKAEIESIYHFSIDYLIHDYIPQKMSMITSPMQEIIDANKNFNEKFFKSSK